MFYVSGILNSKTIIVIKDIKHCKFRTQTYWYCCLSHKRKNIFDVTKKEYFVNKIKIFDQWFKAEL